MSIYSPTHRAIARGLHAAVLVDNVGNVVFRAGDISQDDLEMLSHVLMSLSGEDRSERLFAGELIELTMDGREGRIGIAGRCLFVVAIAREGEVPTRLDVIARDFREEVARALDGLLESAPAAPRKPPGTPSGPASLPALLGIPRRGRGQA